MFTLFDVEMIKICTCPAAPITERVLSLAERVAYSRYSINLRLLNWRVPGLLTIQLCPLKTSFPKDQVLVWGVGEPDLR